MKLRIIVLALLASCTAMPTGAATATDTAKPEPVAASTDVTVLTAQRIHTMDPAATVADAMAFDADGLILALGSSAELRKRYPGAANIDAGRATIVPGLIDAHGHVGNLGLAQMRAELSGTRSKAEVLERLVAFAKTLPPGEWLLGQGWDQNDWEGKNFPAAADLDQAFPDRPVWVSRIDGHASWANSAAMRLSKRDLAGSWQPDGGQIIRDGARPTGIFVDAAVNLIESLVPVVDDAMMARALKLGMSAAIATGITGVHDAGVSLSTMRVYQKLADANELPLRVYAMADGDDLALAWLCSNGLYQHPWHRLEMRAVKLYADGALGSRGAALLADYSDDPGNKGLMVTQPAALEKAALKARACGVQVATHAIGDRGNQATLDMYAKALGKGVDSDHRWRIEHAQVVAPSDFPRLAKLKVIASMQPTHATSDMPWAETRVGPERIKGAYAWRQFINSGARLALGSDFPVESVDPRLGLYAAVTRTDAQGAPAGGWRSQERLSAREALRGFTSDAAFAGFGDDEIGTLVAGKRADFIVLGADPLARGTDLRNMPVLATYVDGKPVYQAPLSK